MGHKIGVTEHSLAGLETCMSDIPRDLFELSFVYECLSTVPSFKQELDLQRYEFNTVISRDRQAMVDTWR
jgi:hypothetical protein